MDTKGADIVTEAIEHVQGSSIFRTKFDIEKTSASLAIIATLSEALDTNPIGLSPLQGSIDVDALDVLTHKRNGMDGDARIRFTHEGYMIDVRSYGEVIVERIKDSAGGSGTDAEN